MEVRPQVLYPEADNVQLFQEVQPRERRVSSEGGITLCDYSLAEDPSTEGARVHLVQVGGTEKTLLRRAEWGMSVSGIPGAWLFSR